MRPADHPEFYRLPPPEGRSRESTIVLDRHGRFWHDGEPVEHPAMMRAFATWISRHPDDGRYVLDNGYDWTYLTVEDAPFVVTAVRSERGRPVLVLTDGSEEPLDPRALRLGDADALYARVKAGQSAAGGDRAGTGAYEARFAPFAQTQLAEWLVEGPDARIELQVDGTCYAVPTRPPVSAD